MNLFLIIGMTGQGKSTFVKNHAIKDKRCFVFDVNNEYQYLPMDEKAPQARYFGDYKYFLQLCKAKTKTNIIFEEATGFLKGAQGKDIRSLIIAKRHTQNNYFFIFHSVQSVPPDIYLLANYVILFKTNDNPDTIKKKYPRLLRDWLELMRQSGKPCKHIKLIDN
jgi:hypothetical protein